MKDEEFKPIIIGPPHESHAAIISATKEHKAVLIVDDAIELKVTDLLDQVVRDANRRQLLPTPIVIPSHIRSRGRGTNKTPKKKKRR